MKYRGNPRKWCGVGRCAAEQAARDSTRQLDEQGRFLCLGCGCQLAGRSRKWCGDNSRCAAAAKPERLDACLWCDGDLPPQRRKGNPSRYCSRPCADRAARAEGRRSQGVSRHSNGTSHKERASAYGAVYEPVNRRRVFERDGWLCQLCQQPIDPDLRWPDPGSASLDHVVPISRGGEHSYRNVWAAHLDCNCSKGSREVSHGWSRPRAKGLSRKSA